MDIAVKCLFQVQNNIGIARFELVIFIVINAALSYLIMLLTFFDMLYPKLHSKGQQH